MSDTYDIRTEFRYDDDPEGAMAREIRDLRAEVKRLKSREITEEQIDKAWEYAHFHTRGEHRDICLELLLKLGIVECPECIGHVGMYSTVTGLNCPRCDGHGWIREEYGDDE